MLRVFISDTYSKCIYLFILVSDFNVYVESVKDKSRERGIKCNQT